MPDKILEIQDVKYFVPSELHNDFIYRFMQKHKRIYERDLISFLMQYIDSDSIVLDVGANIGNHSIQFAKKAKKVFAFEPMKQSYDLFEKNMVLNNIENVRLYRIAIADERCKLEIDTSKLNMQTSSGGVFLSKSENGYVLANSIDNIFLSLKDKISVVKIDVEEMELQVLLGALKIIKRHFPVIYTEIKRARNGAEQKLKDISQVLKPLGYENLYREEFMGDVWIPEDRR